MIRPGSVRLFFLFFQNSFLCIVASKKCMEILRIWVSSKRMHSIDRQIINSLSLWCWLQCDDASCTYSCSIMIIILSRCENKNKLNSIDPNTHGIASSSAANDEKYFWSLINTTDRWLIVVFKASLNGKMKSIDRQTDFDRMNLRFFIKYHVQSVSAEMWRSGLKNLRSFFAG